MVQQQPKRVIGHYELGPRLGSGAQGDVFRARRQDSKDLVALKVFRLQREDVSAEEIRRRVQREVAGLRAIAHPGVVRVLDAGEAPAPQSDPITAAYLYVAYELIDGYDLSEALSQPRPPQPSEVVDLVNTLADALEEMHRHDIIHRDIKPSNVRLRGEVWSTPVLVDFGCLRMDGASTLTTTVAAIGTLAYMAPEVRQSIKRASPSSDQWSLARLTAEAVVVAVDNSYGYEDMRTWDSEAIVGDQVAPELPNVAECLARALDPDPSGRYASAGAFGSAFLAAAIADRWVSQDPEAKAGSDVARFPNEPLVQYFARQALPVIDKRRVAGGNLWVVAGREEFAPYREEMQKHGVWFSFVPHGGRASGGRPAWYTPSKE